MLVWINGPFGGGKTAVAFELRRRVDRAIVCDPERLGYGLHRMLPPALRTDFQNFAAWRHGVHEVLDLAARKWDGPVIVPMTLIDPVLGYAGTGRRSLISTSAETGRLEAVLRPARPGGRTAPRAKVNH